MRGDRPDWNPDWLRVAEYEGRAVVLHGSRSGFFLCYSSTPRDYIKHKVHLATLDRREADRVFEELVEALRNELL